eukprot:TRINITY_DN9132_c0_g1_i1.p1 TRINITY_DN9132_c0_g1~~TRINITY_DN9132_c0_g1_i1.p1  ORF type:complete len:490 (-),score=99.41 TRINITY_DN9132_c0_g1_i1:188-1492(-)
MNTFPVTAAAIPSGQTEGLVKSWNGSKGYGFITSPGVAGDVMFARSELPQDHKEVRGKFLEGKTVRFDWESQADGRPKATSVAIVYKQGDQLAGVIKSYSGRHGYGFITSSTLGEDVRFQKNDFAVGTADNDLQGKLVTFDASALADGKMRATRVMFQSKMIATEVNGANLPVIGNPNAQGMAGGMAGQFVSPPKQPQQLQQAAPQVLPQQAEVLGAVLASCGMQAQIPTVLAALGVGNMGGMAGMGGMVGMGGMATGAAADASMMSGVVKSYSERNGYGFIKAAGVPTDLRFGTQDIQGGSISSGAAVRFVLHQGAHGMQARQVTITDMSGMGGAGVKREANGFGLGETPAKQQRAAPQTVATGQWSQGVVKSFRSDKGYGFITVPQFQGDVFFMKSDIPLEAGGELAVGQTVAFELLRTSDGKFRAQTLTVV